VAQKFDTKRFNLKKLNDVEIKEQHQIKISNRFPALESSNHNVDITWAWEVLEYKNFSHRESRL
jgi:hypothetical protein